MGMDQFNLQKYAQQQNSAQGLDEYKLANLLGGAQVAGQAQNAQQQRTNDAFNALFKMNDAESNKYGQFYGQGGQLSGSAYEDAMNALMAQYGYQSQGKIANAQSQADQLKTLFQLYQLYQGKPSGGGGGSTPAGTPYSSAITDV
jgi:TorA maturation chaperone TorD